MDYENEQLKYGALPPVVRPFSYQYGGMTDIDEGILFEKGCVAYLPESEMQVGIYFDTLGCVSFSFFNGLETVGTAKIELEKLSQDNIDFLKKKFFKNGRLNFCDRDLVVLSKTDPEKGNDGWSVFLAAKNNGPVPETSDDFDLGSRDYSVNNKNEYYKYTRSKAAQKLADEFNKRFEIKAEWVAREDWLEASKRGALQVYTKAWYKRPETNKYYNPTPGQTNHAIQMADVEELKIFDSYDPFLKELERPEDFYYFALKINLIEKSMEKPKLINNTFVRKITAPQEVGVFLDGKIIIDANETKIQGLWISRNEKNGFFTGGPARSITQAQWDLFDKVDLNGNPIIRSV